MKYCYLKICSHKMIYKFLSMYKAYLDHQVTNDLFVKRHLVQHQ